MEMAELDERLQFTNGFIDYLNESCSAFHAVEAAKIRLLSAGFVRYES